MSTSVLPSKTHQQVKTLRILSGLVSYRRLGSERHLDANPRPNFTMHITINSLSFLLVALLVSISLAVSVSVHSEAVRIKVHESSSHSSSPSTPPVSISTTTTTDIIDNTEDGKITLAENAPHQVRQDVGQAARVGLLDQDAEALAEFQQKVGSVVRDMMEQEIKKFVDDMSQQAMGQLTDQLLSFSLMGQRYLCLNMVRPSASTILIAWG